MDTGPSGDDRQRQGRSRFAGRSIGSGIRMFQARTQLIAAENHRAELGEILIAAGMIGMNVRIDEIANGLGG